MKATILTSVFAVLVSISSINAKNVITYSNEASNEHGTIKEYVTVDKHSLKPETKENYNYDSNGKLQEKTISIWTDETGWTNSAKYEYTYGEANKISGFKYTEGHDNNKWENKSLYFIHIYDENDNLLSVKQIQVEDKTDYNYDLISLK